MDVLPIELTCSDEQACYQVTGFADPSFASATFGPASAVVVSEHKVGDFNGDGAIDVIAVGNGAALQLYLNSGNNTFTVNPIVTNATTNFAVEVIDWDGDSDDDFVITQGNKVLLFRNDGMANFTEEQLYQGSNNLTAIGIADFDGDSDYDFAVRRLGVVSFIENDGMGTFTRRTSIVSGFTGTYNVTNQLHTVDLDADGDMDLIAASSPNGTPKVFLNDGNYAFVASVAVPNDDSQARIIRTGDMDGDGNLDIVVGLIKSIWVLYQDNAGNFTRNIVFDGYGSIGDMEVADVDNDGFMDIIATGANSDDLDIFYNDNNVGSFTLRSSGFATSVFNRIAIANYDTDSDLDFICFATNKSAFWIEHNPAIFNNTVSLGFEIDGVADSEGGLTVNGAGTTAFKRNNLVGTHSFVLKSIFSGGIDATKNIIRSYDVLNADAEVAVGYQGQVYPNPDLSITSAANGRAYGSIPADQMATQTFTITNSGTSTLRIVDIDYIISQGTFQNVFQISPSNNVFIPANNSADFDVTFNPNGLVSTWRADITVTSNACNDTEYIFRISATSSQPLPITLTNFSAQAIDNQTLINWQTASEITANGFQIEWRTDDSAWSTIGFMNSENRAAQYEFIHPKPAKGTNYYRLKMLDNDGQFEYSPVRSVELRGNDFIENWLAPNPTKDEITITLPTNFKAEKSTEITIFNNAGQLIKRLNVAENHRLSLADLPNGLYYIRLQQGSLNVGQRVIKH
ncbi:MAG: FG-GAP-like repeat-containing protein [Saprospiraceae bacterium]